MEVVEPVQVEEVDSGEDGKDGEDFCRMQSCLYIMLEKRPHGQPQSITVRQGLA